MTKATRTHIDLPGLSVKRTSAQLVAVRLFRPTAADIAALAAGFSVGWPTSLNTTAATNALTVLWTGPAEWLVRHAGPLAVAELVEAACPETLSLVCDVSAGRAIYRVSGASARDLLAKDCGLDLHPRAFADGACAQTLLAQVAVLIHRRGAAFDVYVDRSYAAHLAAWFEDASIEFRPA